MELYRTYGTLGEEDNDVTWVAPTPMLFRLYKAFREFVSPLPYENIRYYDSLGG